MILVTTPAKVETFAEFLHPHEHEPGTVEYSIREVDDRDPNVFPGPPSDAFGVRFYDVICVNVTRGAKTYTCQSGRFNYSKGTHFYTGNVIAQDKIDDHGPTLVPGIANVVLRMTMKDKGWSHVIHCWGLVVPFDPTRDTAP